MFLNNKRRFLSSTAIALVLTAMPHSSRAAIVINNDTTYGPTDNLEGYTTFDHGGDETINAVFTAGEGEFFNIGGGINSVNSVTSIGEDSSTLNIEITNGGGELSTSGVVFEDDILAINGRIINLNVSDGNVIFKGNVGTSFENSVNITAITNYDNDENIIVSTSKLDFQIANDDDLNIYSAIKKEVGNTDTLNMSVANTSGNAERTITFYDIGRNEEGSPDVFVDTLTIGDSGGAKTNNVIFDGQYLSTDNINIGFEGRSATQTHNLQFNNNAFEVKGVITGLAADDITIVTQGGGDSVTFFNSVSNIDNIIVTADSSMSFRGDVTDSSISLQTGSTVNFDSDGEERSHVSADIISQYATIQFDTVDFSGSVTVVTDSSTNIQISNGAQIGYEEGGNITLANASDSISSTYGNNTLSSSINFGAGDDTFSLADSNVSLNGAMTNLENITIADYSTLFIYEGGSYTGNITGDNSGSLTIGASYNGELAADDSSTSYDSAGTIDNVNLSIYGSATFDTNGHEFGTSSEGSHLYSLSVRDNAIFNIQDDVLVRGEGAAILGNSTIRIGAGATLNTSVLQSDSSSDATLIFDLASPSSAGFLEVTDENLDLTYITVEANLTGADSLFSNGNQIKVAQGEGALVGTSGEEGQEATLITENSALFSISMMDGSKLSSPANASDLYLVFSQESTIEEIANSGNNKTVGKVFDDISNTSNPELSQIVDNLNAASESELQTLLDSTTPDVGGGVAVGSQNFVNNTLDITNQQIDMAMNSSSGIASGDRNKGVRMWGQYFFEDARQGKRGGIAGFNSTTNGAALGVDSTELFENSVVGLGFSFGDTKVDSNNASRAENKINSYQLTAYGSYSLPANYFIKAMAAYAYNEVKSMRHNVGGIGLNAKGEYSANIYTFRADVGKDFYNNGNMRFTPSFMTHYSRYNAQDYNETGAGGANLNVNSKALEIFELGTNLELGWDFKLANKGRFMPEIRAGYRYDLVGDRFRARSSFAGGGTGFDTVGVNPAKSALTFGGGLVYQVGDQWDLSLNYEYEHRQKFHSNSGFARAAYHF